MSELDLSRIPRDSLEEMYRRSLLFRQKDWQPIETAPKDGDSILLLFQGEGFDPIVDMCFWDCYGQEPSWTLGGECECRFSRPQGGYTHWQPLPSTET